MWSGETLNLVVLSISQFYDALRRRLTRCCCCPKMPFVQVPIADLSGAGSGLAGFRIGTRESCRLHVPCEIRIAQAS